MREGLWGDPEEDPEGGGSGMTQGRGGGRGLWGDPGEGWREGAQCPGHQPICHLL